jgi:DNA-binding CsgD family transcriptional regulator
MDLHLAKAKMHTGNQYFGRAGFAIFCIISLQNHYRMNESLQIVIITGSLITGVVAIIFCHQLVRKYKLPYLTSYFYYLIFLFIFGIYGIIGSNLIRTFLRYNGMDARGIESTYLVVTYLGIPFLILSWYMFLRLSHEIVGRTVATAFNLLFFGVLSVTFLVIGLFMIRRDVAGEYSFDRIRFILLATFTLISLLIYGYSLLQLFVHSGKFLDRKDRSNIRLFGLLYLVFAAGTILLVNFSHYSKVIGFTLIILLFAIHLIPLFFLSLHLDKNFVEPVARQEFDRSLGFFITKFEISKRESEVVELICKGKSNQEISDSLFISLQTVKDHIHRIYLKTGVKNRVQLTNLIRTVS